MECGRVLQYQQHLAVECCSSAVSDEGGLGYCSSGRLSAESCRVVDVEMEVGGSGGREEEGAETSEAAHPAAGEGADMPFSKELITLSLFGKMPAKISELQAASYMILHAD